ncbi:MAG: hypothetical protein LUD77_02025 [Clostridiales bacterium]|nr:hypothetical protein [Clostridiales bacterium]
MTAEELTEMLNSYRELEPQAPNRLYINKLLEQSQKYACNNTDETKKLHNLIVLWFIVEPKQNKKPVCDVLHMSRQPKYFESMKAKAVNRLLEIAKTI